MLERTPLGRLALCLAYRTPYPFGSIGFVNAKVDADRGSARVNVVKSCQPNMWLDCLRRCNLRSMSDVVLALFPGALRGPQHRGFEKITSSESIFLGL